MKEFLLLLLFNFLIFGLQGQGYFSLKSQQGYFTEVTKIESYDTIKRLKNGICFYTDVTYNFDSQDAVSFGYMTIFGFDGLYIGYSTQRKIGNFDIKLLRFNERAGGINSINIYGSRLLYGLLLNPNTTINIYPHVAYGITQLQSWVETGITLRYNFADFE